MLPASIKDIINAGRFQQELMNHLIEFCVYKLSDLAQSLGADLLLC